ncbi:MAB_1171c family putative transporter [Streptomyces sp. NPDC001595]|uniref:MAB_1171c family putative transporter n=1 Tax=Streptomyces sp. NPDC001532 TaxID=3154520 RepID=UPI00332F41C3
MSTRAISHLPYALPTVLLLAGLGAKLPTFLRSWRNPDVRATWFVLLWASGVFLSVAPSSIHRINAVTGVPNIAAPWIYSLLAGFCGACLAMIITWREEPSDRRRRRIRWVWLIHAGIITALWVTFLLAEVPEERIYDLDTYYATTPWMREHILLYLLEYLTSTVVSAWMIWTWISQVGARWLKTGLVFLQAGYAFGVVFAVAKLTAVGARWTGRDWDTLSVDVAPPFAILGATLVAVGFLLPLVGPFLQTWPREQNCHWALRPLARLMDAVGPSAARARVGRFAPLDLRLMQRRQHIHDGLLRLAPYVDHDLYRRAHQEAAARHGTVRARGLAGAVTIQAAVGSFGEGARRESAHREDARRDTRAQPPQIGTDITDHIESISRALRHPRAVEDLRRRVSPHRAGGEDPASREPGSCAPESHEPGSRRPVRLPLSGGSDR